MKVCNKCGRECNEEDFYKNKAMPGGRLKVCKACCGTYRKEYAARNPDKEAVWRQNHKDRNPESGMDYYWRTRGSDPRLMRDYTLKKRYGLSVEDYERMCDDQGGLCFICGKEPKTLHVDHCHETGRVRKLLCPGCNMRLGVVESEHLPAMLEYVDAHD
jgi:hypothetical protein